MTLRTSRPTRKTNPVGILITNIGSPQAPTSAALRKYLSEFLSDHRIIDWPRWLWLPILKGIVLTFRPKRSARLYKNVWKKGSPLFNIMSQQTNQLAELIKQNAEPKIKLVNGMRYGKPSIADGLKELKNFGAKRILIFPLFPQYSSTTTASTYDAVFDELKSWSWMPELQLISNYHDNPDYIRALTNSILEFWEDHGKAKKLLFSFHGVPERYTQTDDPYYQQCQCTAQLVAKRLEMPSSAWHVSFQSRFGPEDWLQPYTVDTLRKWGKDKLESVHVICPGFSADCLETLDEINREARDVFKEAGGKEFHYIPALNNRSDHIKLLGQTIIQCLNGWSDNSSLFAQKSKREGTQNH